jgi:hypothetical protein
MSPVIGRDALNPLDINERFAIDLPSERDDAPISLRFQLR